MFFYVGKDRITHMKKKIVLAVVTIVVTCLVVYVFYPRLSGYFSDDADAEHIISMKQNIPISDVKMFIKGFPAQSAEEDPREYFSREIVNAYTVRFFKFLETQIEFTSMDDHLKAVKAYLYSKFPPLQAQEMFALYRKFLDYEIQIHEKAKAWGQPKTAEELLRYLQSVQDYRRDIFGKEIADAMWGAEVKAHEYTIRKNGIKNDPNLYGAEKERRISHLKEEMWGADAVRLEDAPQTDSERYEVYQEKQELYQKDLQQLTEYEKLRKIKEFREKYFTAEQMAKLEQVDREMEHERLRESDYYAKEKAILNDFSLSDEKKALAIQELQNSLFGEDADALRRRINIQKQASP